MPLPYLQAVQKNRLLMGILMLAGVLAGLLARGKGTDAIRAKAHEDTGCPLAQVTVTWRSGRSSSADVDACGQRLVYVSGWFGAPSRVE